MKNSNDTIGKRTRDLPVCSAVSQPTAPPAACPSTHRSNYKFMNVLDKKLEGRCNSKSNVGECRLDSCSSGYGSESGYIKNGNKPAS